MGRPSEIGMTEIMPVPRILILMSYQQKAFCRVFSFAAIFDNNVDYMRKICYNYIL